MNFTPLPARNAPLRARGVAGKALESAIARTGCKLELYEGEEDGRAVWFVRERNHGTITETGWMGLGQLVSYLGALCATS